jgi:mRNA-degrading endonuclease RelE of RelBE toxin-antitoxin system
MFEVGFSEGAFEDLPHLKKTDQQVVLEAIEQQLVNDPLVPTRNRKPLQPNDLSAWEIRVGSRRVFMTWTRPTAR